ncbi:prepilin peptidase dependent protein B [Raoultella sp. BIGb0138]|uniref:prepilin peptidase-dependent protein n=1 Tax=Raoultella sp. BIGb0138 TaxID=2485115 RepID=UPI0010502B1E|nr:prepilin peptidase-dependent protein [Raoultella sp. BIGb0138]TCW11779.1 prepilin peptidase dependent protein B [Raoultella sp. BIGb0138]
MPVICRGFSLPETLIAMAISTILLMGTSRFLPALQRLVLRQTQQQSLDNELWQRLYTVAKHLQRAGYCHGSCEGQPLQIASGGDCVIVRWDGDSNGVWEAAPEATSDTTGFRLLNGALETRRGVTSCSGGGWEKMTNPVAIAVTHFQVIRRDIAGFAPEFTVLLAARSQADPTISVQAEYRVTGYNL